MKLPYTNLDFEKAIKRKPVAQEELKDKNIQINKILGKIAEIRYKMEKNDIELYKTLNQKHKVDDMLKYKTQANISKPKLSKRDYMLELDKFDLKLEKAKNKYIDKIVDNNEDVNLYFPENMRCHLNMLKEIRENHYEKCLTTEKQFKERQQQIIESYLVKKDKIKLTMDEISSTDSKTVQDKKNRLKLAQLELKQLEQQMQSDVCHLLELATDLNINLENDLNESVKNVEKNINAKLSTNSITHYPLKLDIHIRNDDNQKIMQRRLINLTLMKQKCLKKIQNINKIELDDTEPDIDNIQGLNKNTKLSIKSLNTIKELDKYDENRRAKMIKYQHTIEQLNETLNKLYNSRTLLVDEINVLEQMENLYQSNFMNNVVHDIISSVEIENAENSIRNLIDIGSQSREIDYTEFKSLSNEINYDISDKDMQQLFKYGVNYDRDIADYNKHKENNQFTDLDYELTQNILLSKDDLDNIKDDDLINAEEFDNILQRFSNESNSKTSDEEEIHTKTHNERQTDNSDYLRINVSNNFDVLDKQLNTKDNTDIKKDLSNFDSINSENLRENVKMIIEKAEIKKIQHTKLDNNDKIKDLLQINSGF